MDMGNVIRVDFNRWEVVDDPYHEQVQSVVVNDILKSGDCSAEADALLAGRLSWIFNSFKNRAQDQPEFGPPDPTQTA